HGSRIGGRAGRSHRAGVVIVDGNRRVGGVTAAAWYARRCDACRGLSKGTDITAGQGAGTRIGVFFVVQSTLVVVHIVGVSRLKARAENRAVHGLQRRGCRSRKNGLPWRSTADEDIEMVAVVLNVSGKENIEIRALNGAIGGVQFRTPSAVIAAGGIAKTGIDGLQLKRRAVVDRGCAQVSGDLGVCGYRRASGRERRPDQ